MRNVAGVRRPESTPATQALVTYDLGAPEALEFADVHPDHTTVTLDYRGTPYYVLLAT